MNLPRLNPPASPVAPRTDLRGAFVWVALGALIVFASWRMDRLTELGATVYTAPGLWPGIVGFLLAVMGGVLALRSLQRARATSWDTAQADDVALVPRSRFALAAAMFFVYAVLLVGHGLPFWLATAIFVTAFVFVFRRADRMIGMREGTDRGDLTLALVCGMVTAAVVPLVFEQLFYVRLP